MMWFFDRNMGAFGESGGKPRALQSGFTLVELLVVIAILGALAGIAVPVSMSMAAKGRESACLVNLRGIGVGLQLYLNDNQGVLPVLAAGREGRSAEGDVLETVLLPYVDEEGVFECPADDEEFVKTGSSYGWNVTQNGLRMSEVDFFGEDEKPEMVPLVFDKEAWHEGDTNFLYADTSVSKKVRFVWGGEP
ncbi:MAG: type II secretion system protein [Luteolibacter sp.]